MSFDEKKRETTAHEKRLWLRLTRVCNNRCLFCLDSGAQDGTVLPYPQILEKMKEGRLKGATRLILSGGEPTIHPKFLQFVAQGKALGYSWIQVVTNGRMFSYGELTRRAIASGLNEVTFSMPAHQQDLFDRLVGVSGAFEQSLKSLRNALRAPELVVSIDVVINRLNIKELPQILQFYLDEGVREFDLLQIVPFGRAFDPSKEDGGGLIYDPRKEVEVLQEALEVVDRRDVVVWTNRLDPIYLEGFEKWIQDPHKISDEVRGRREALQAFVRGQGMECRQKTRCRLCFLRRYCLHLEKTLKEFSGWWRVSAKNPLEPWLKALNKRFWDPKGKASKVRENIRVCVVASGMDEGMELLERIREKLKGAGFITRGDDEGVQWMLELLDGSFRKPSQTDRVHSLVEKGVMGSFPLERLILHSSEDLEAVLPIGSQAVEVSCGLNKKTAPILEALAFSQPNGSHQNPTPKGSIHVFLEERLKLSESMEGDISPREVFCEVETSKTNKTSKTIRHNLVAESIPPCLLCGAPSVSAPSFLDVSTFDPEGFLDPVRFVDLHLRRGYRVYSLRCEGCFHRTICPGAPIQFIRHFGFEILEPMTSSKK